MEVLREVLTTGAAAAPSPAVDDELTSVLRKKLDAKVELKKWSRAVEHAVVGSEERKKAKEQQAIYLQRVTSLEQQITAFAASQSRKRVLAPVEDNDTSMPRCMKKALPMLSGLLGSSRALDPSRSLEDRVLELGTKLNDDTEKVLFRSCYYSAIFDHILPLLERNAAVLVGGAPGVGKSVLGMLLSIVLIHDRHKIVLFEHSGARILLASPSCEKEALDTVLSSLKMLRLDPDEFDVGTNVVFKVIDDQLFKELRDKKNIVFIQDLGDSATEVIPLPGKPFVLIASPNTERIKRANRGRMLNYVFLPPWTLEELQVASRQCFDGKLTPAQVQERYLKFGGIARSVLDVHAEWSEVTADETYEKALNGCAFESLSETFRSAYQDLRKGPISAMLIHAIPASPDTRGVSGKFKNKFASEETKKRLIDRFLEATTLKAAELLNAVRNVPELAEFVGRYLERNFHRSLCEGTFQVRPLSTDAVRFRKVEFPVMVKVGFTRDDFMDIHSVLRDHYYQPSRTNFDTLDSFALLSARLFFGPKATGNVLVIFQITKSSEHKLNGVIVKRLQDRLNALGVKFTKTLFVWVSSVDGILQEQKVTNGDGNQYVHGAPNMEQWLLALGKDHYNELFTYVLKFGNM